MLTKTAPIKPLRWQRSRYSLMARQVDIFSSAATLAFFLWVDTVIARNSTTHRNRRAQWLLGTLLDLGPTFIKIGQALSTRADLLPAEYVEALGRLQDQVPEFSSVEAIAIVEAELGSSINTLYREFDRFPLAAASLGQVHRARLHTGEDVVVKIQRPGLEKLFDLDFKVLRRLLNFCKRFLPKSRRKELDEIYEEFFSILYKEIDYEQEGKNADRFRQNFQGYPRIRVPTIYWRYSTKRVLTMEYVPGIKVNDRQTLEACGLNVKEINQVGISCYLKQLLQDGFFQADPHPGNLAVTQEGDLVFYDFGMMGEIKPTAKGQMVKTFFAVMNKDTNAVIDNLVDMGLLVPVKDMVPVRRLTKFILDKFTEKPLDLKAFEQLRSEIYSMFEQQPFRLPAQMTFILKSLTTLDGIARVLDPEYNLMSGAQPFIRSIVASKGTPGVLGELARQARSFVKQRLNRPSPAEELIRRLEERIEQGELKVRVRSLETDRTLKQIHLAIKSLIYACLTGFTFLAGAVLVSVNHSSWAVWAFVLSGLGFLFLLRSLLDLAVREKLDRMAD